jgi:hypothetical protein
MEVCAVLGIQGGPNTTDDPSDGLVWRSIINLLNTELHQNEFVSKAIVGRGIFSKHPWSIGGGGAAELKQTIEQTNPRFLKELITDLGRTTHTGEDDLFYLAPWAANTQGLSSYSVPLVIGEGLRDWKLNFDLLTLFPYDQETGEPVQIEAVPWIHHFWIYRTTLKDRMDFGNYIEDRGLRWFDHSMFFPQRYKSLYSIAFAEIVSHNHFVLNRGRKVFNRTAPVIKLPAGTNEEDHLKLVGVLNSSTACFWMKQISHVKTQTTGMDRHSWQLRSVFDAAKVGKLPLPSDFSGCYATARKLDELACRTCELSPDALASREEPTAKGLDENRRETGYILERMIVLQEELDWLCYRLYGLLDADDPAAGTPETWETVPGLALGERPFEIVLARKVAAWEEQTAWFERHGSTPITQVPGHWPEWYRNVVERRIELIETDANIGLIERPEYKRRWNREPWDKQVSRALRGWLLDRLESSRYWPCHHDTPDVPPELTSVARLADRASADAEFLQVAALYRGSEAVDVSALVVELVESESVPFLPMLRYTETGLRTRAEWRETWRLQQLEDEGQPLLDRDGRPLPSVPVPSKYTSKDFLKPTFWGLRGKLDVPRERWVSYPGCESPGDPTRVVGWAGWDHLQQATAVAGHFVRLKDEGIPADRLIPLLAGIDELVFWLKLWHNAFDPSMGMGLGDYYEDFVTTETMALGYTVEQVRAWVPPPPDKGKRGRKAKV